MADNHSALDRLALNLATLGPVGHLPKAPGTWGSAVGLMAAPFLFLPHSPLTRAAILAALFVVGALASNRAEKIIGEKDPGCVVIDEVLGQWVCLLPFSILPAWQMLAAFILFRAFDIIKPPPVKWSENWLPGGWGVMLDDLLAGAWAAAGLWAARWTYINYIAAGGPHS